MEPKEIKEESIEKQYQVNVCPVCGHSTCDWVSCVRMYISTPSTK
jgi:hypothetical protein